MGERRGVSPTCLGLPRRAYAPTLAKDQPCPLGERGERFVAGRRAYGDVSPVPAAGGGRLVGFRRPADPQPLPGVPGGAGIHPPPGGRLLPRLRYGAARPPGARRRVAA